MIILDDLKYALRLLFKRPGFTVLTTLVMATGIGLSVYLFSFFNTTQFKPLPFTDGGSLIVINKYQIGANGFGRELNLHDYYEIRNNVKGISEFGAFSDYKRNVSGRDSARLYSVTYAEPNIFQITRTKPILGRGFMAADNQSGAENVAVIGYDMWQNQFAGNADALGEILGIQGKSHRIIGVMPQGYTFPVSADMWLPMQEDATKLSRGEGGTYYGLGHLEDGFSMQDINAQLDVISQRIAEKYPETNNDISAYVSPLQSSMGPKDAGVFIYTMHGITILVLILASVNVGNLLFSRAIERGKETAIRVALGAPRARLISQMIWESVIICSVGGLIGLLFVGWGLEITNPITATFFGGKPPFWWHFGVDAFTLKLCASFVIGTIFVTGFLPAWKNSGADFNAVLRDGTRGALGKKAGRLNRLLVISEIFLSMTVLIAAGAQVASTYNSTFADYGADTANTLTARLMLPEDIYDSLEKQTQIMQTLQSRLENSVGIGHVMLSSALPGDGTSDPSVALEGKEYGKNGVATYPRANSIAVSPGTLLKLGVELRNGRYFSSVDNGLGKTSVIVTDSFVTLHFPDESPLGKRLRFVEQRGDDPEWLTIVGVVEHTIQGSPDDDSGKLPSVFRPYSQAPRASMTIAVEMEASRSLVVRTLRQVLQSIDPDLPVYQIQTYEEKMADKGAASRFIATLFLLFGVAAVILAASGIYGVMSNTINQKTQEIGIKLALGAGEQRIMKEFLMTGLKQLLWGGVPGAYVGYLMGAMMLQTFGQESVLLIIALSMIIVIGFVVMLSAYFPTKRALQMEPSEALRYE